MKNKYKILLGVAVFVIAATAFFLLMLYEIFREVFVMHVSHDSEENTDALH